MIARVPALGMLRCGILWRGRTSGPGALEAKLAPREPGERGQDQQCAVDLRVGAFRPVLRCDMPVGVVDARQRVRLGELVECVEDELQRKQREEDRRDLEEKAEIDAMPPARPVRLRESVC